MQTRLELYQLVAPLAGLGIWERDLKTGAVYWNSIIREILGIGPDLDLELDGSISFYKDPQAVRDLIAEARSTGRPLALETELVSAKGDHKFVRVRIQSGFENGDCISIYGTLEDISREVSLRHRSAELEQRFVQAFDHAPIGMALVSTSGEWIKVNKSLSELLGYSQAELMQRTFQELTHPDDLGTDIRQMQQVLANEISSYSMEKRYYRSDGRLIWVLLNVSVVRDELDLPLYFVSQIKDITERKRNAAIIQQQNSRLLDFAHLVSHDLRSHIGNMTLVVDTIASETDRSERDNLIAMLHENGKKLLDTLARLNEVVKVHEGGSVSKKDLLLYDEVQSVLGIMDVFLKEAGAKVRLDIERGVRLLFDPAYLKSILIGLVSNSIKYRAPEQPLKISIEAARDRTKATLRFRDNGLGIDPGLEGRNVFGAYRTLHSDEHERGMGLALVKSQVEAMGGSIQVESGPDIGTSFTIEFNNEA